MPSKRSTTSRDVVEDSYQLLSLGSGQYVAVIVQGLKNMPECEKVTPTVFP
jgi:hypothetical protein